MTDEKTETPPTEEPEPKSKRAHSEQNQRVARRVSDVLRLLTTAKDDKGISPLLASKGYDSAKLAEGLSLQQAAENALIARQQAIGAQKEATLAVQKAEETARQAFKDFRDIARSIFKDTSVRSALGVNDPIAKQLETFMTNAGTSYGAALAEPQYLAELARYGFPQSSIESARASLQALAAANDAQESAKAAASSATKQRDDAIAALDAWVRQFEGIAKVATRSRRDLAKKLGL
jgi:hypothetical protein